MIFENKETKILVREGKPKNYASLVLFCYEQPCEEGITLVEMKKDLDVIDVIEKNINEKEFEISHETAESMKKIVGKTKFGMRLKELSDFGEYISSLS